MNRFILGKTEQSIKSSYMWNSIGGILNSCQSALMLIIISRTNPDADSGIFAMAYAIATMASAVGKFGMRNYQSTDIDEKYDYGIYVVSRIVTSIGMLLVVLYYILKGVFFLDYSTEKCIVILLFGLMKLLDVVEDIVHGRLQQIRRLDIGAKCMTIRYILTLFVYGIMLCVTHELVFSTLTALVVSFGFLIYTFWLVRSTTGVVGKIKINDKRVYRLLWECIGLALSSFLMLYISNSPKYAIDELMGDEIQACFNYIFMPVFVVSMLNSFIYQPVLTKLTYYWNQQDYKQFTKMLFIQIILLTGLVLLVLTGGFIIGIPALSLLYNTDLTIYKLDFMILLVGSGFLALSGYLGVILTIMRRQNWQLLAYVSTALFALLSSKWFVANWEILGAVILYFSLVFIQSFVLGGLVIVFYHQAKKEK